MEGGNSIAGIEKHNAEEIDEKYTMEDIKLLEKLGLTEKDIKSKK